MTADIIELKSHQQDIILPMDILRVNLSIAGHIARELERTDMNLMLATRMDGDDGFTRNGYQALVYIRNSLDATIQRCDNSIRNVLEGRR